MTMPANRAEFRVSRALTAAAVRGQVIPTVALDIVTTYYSPVDSAVYWVEDLASYTGAADQTDGGESSEIEAGRRMPGGAYEKVETGGRQVPVTLRHYGAESDLSDDEARLAWRNFGMDRGEIHAGAALQQLRVNRDRRLNGLLTATTFTNTAARSGIWTTSTTANHYAKTDADTALDAIIQQCGRPPSMVDMWIPKSMINLLRTSPEMNFRDSNGGYVGQAADPAIRQPDAQFQITLQNYFGVRSVKILNSVRNTAKFMRSGTGAYIFTGDDILFTVQGPPNDGNSGVLWVWSDAEGGADSEPNPNAPMEAIFSGRNPKDEEETYRAKEHGVFAVNVELAYLITAINA